MGWGWLVLGFGIVYVPLLALATWRIAHDVAHEEGPFGLCGSLRRGIKGWVEAQIDASPLAQPQDHPLYWRYVGIDCPRCVSFTAALVVLLVGTSPLTWPLAVWFGIAGLVSWLDRG